jgi:hypothetical protein
MTDGKVNITWEFLFQPAKQEFGKAYYNGTTFAFYTVSFIWRTIFMGSITNVLIISFFLPKVQKIRENRK